MYSSCITAIVLCALMLLLKTIFRKKLCFFTPLTIFCAMSLFCATMMIDLISRGEAGEAPEYGGFYNNVPNWIELGKVFLLFTISGIIGGLLADLLWNRSVANCNTNADEEELQSLIERILKNFFFILFLNALFGILRFIIIFRYLDGSSFGDYREMVCFELFAKLSPIEAIIFRISNHLYVLAGFYICLFGAHIALTGKVKTAKFIWGFLLFSIPTMTTGGRLFILNFLVYFFSGFFLLYGRFSNRKIEWKIFRKFLIFFLFMLALVCIIGTLRDEKDLSTMTKEGRPWDKLGYITDSNVILARCMEYNLGGTAPLFESTLGNAATFLENRETWEDLSGYVNGLYSHLYVDFDAPLMYYIWGILCFLMETITLLSLKRLNIFWLLICCTLAKIMQEMLIFPAISGNYYCFEWILLIFILHCFFWKGNKAEILQSNTEERES